ncbi:MAG: NAD(P)-dependent oxidoreductase [Geothrix sp.]|uniref:NAD-dependent epimerase/dehydratase family protein n=1 Tax=Geothrix sp. TaxID=1962974 RepID=UPI00183C2DF7|nr:NAD(P)-dependent oxidoreductase [Geothrix sp.]NWJ41150.1 NAD(P)-dependent oxidoreductase [Geothrix sp.]WIL20859.1 MAG: NAD(P)-dependent oxidoreductase [Geothrix sp.]
MKVLLTGASGFLGRHVLEALRCRGIETVLVGRHRPADCPLEEYIETDLLAEPDGGTLFRASGATHLLHLAWYVKHGQYWTSELNPRWAEATVRLVDGCCRAGCQGMVLAGTCAEYDWSGGICLEDSTPLRPATPYGASKDAARRQAMALGVQHQVPCAWGRVFLPYGSGEDPRRLVPSLIEVCRGRRAPFAVDAAAHRDFLHASDVAEGFVTLLNRQASGEFNISSGQPVEIGTLVRELARIMGADLQAVLDLSVRRPGEPPLLAGDNRKLRALGWHPQLSLTQGLERTIREALA